MNKTRTLTTLIGALLASGSAVATDLQSVDWSSIPSTELTLFYPGQSSYEWIVNEKHGPGATETRAGKTCLDCHAEEEADIGNLIVSGEKLEPTPIPGKAGSLKVKVQAAFDQEYLYLKAVWAAREAGQYHDYIVYRDGKWEKTGSHRVSGKVAAGVEPPIYEDRFTVMLGDGRGVPEFNQVGCWATCHNDMRFMPDHPDKEAVETHPVLGKGGLKKHDIRKYLLNSRTASDRTGGWNNTKSREEIASLRNSGGFLDLWQWRAHRSNPVGMADDGFVAEYRLFDAGKKMFSDNWDKQTNQPRYMFDPAGNGGKPHLTTADLKQATPGFYLGDTNKVAYDPGYAWKNGDVLVRRVVTGKVEGSAGDNNDVHGSHAGGKWTLVWKRKLDTGNAADDVAMKPGQSYPIGLAVHDDHVTARFHYVSFPMKLGLGNGEGEINAVEIK
ncbi:ethylbenzene dehydrogenase-related protein [Sedimenticola hydrogenitrophicus]|uniref:ethylbenzene dehydrogenase-related protein n=1 Tax=Sedimenticola hydrogenitrophicus TaxID=2967975 RepID=UPI0023AF39B9|nr:ethylbenzene dehydrogenase-related protein [Sedimenticola hydrogenitrophicus]